MSAGSAQPAVAADAPTSAFIGTVFGTSGLSLIEDSVGAAEPGFVRLQKMLLSHQLYEISE
jgi:hypothetical protein